MWLPPVAVTGDIHLFPDLNIPKSTLREWAKKEPPEVISSKTLNLIEKTKLEKEIKKKDQIINRLKSKANLISEVYNELDLSPKNKKVRDIQIKKKIIKIVEKFQKELNKSEILSAISLSQSRIKRWKNEIKDNQNISKSEYQQTHPIALRKEEFYNLKALYSSPQFAHFPISALHYYAKRENILHCSINTWHKYAKNYKLERPYKRNNLKEYKEGIRADSPNEIWHIDISEVKLPSGQRYYLQVVIDNYSRYCLAFQINKSKVALNTIELLKSAREHKSRNTSLMMDKGGENINDQVDNFLEQNKITRIIAKFDTHYSNSIVEAFFRSLKNNYLYFQNPSSLKILKEKVNFYIEEHNHKIPHSAHNGLTPKEVFANMPMNKLFNSLNKMGKKNIEKRQETYYEFAC